MSATYSYNRIIAINGGRDDDDFISASELENNGVQDADSSFGLDSMNDVNTYKTPRKIKEREVSDSIGALCKSPVYRNSLIFLLISWAAS